MATPQNFSPLLDKNVIAVDALLFDLDGTLIDSKRDLAEAVRFVQKAYGARGSSDARIATFIGDGVVQLVHRALPRLGPKALTEAVDVFKTHYRANCLKHTRLYAGVKKTLFHFRHKKLAVVTNKPVRISRRILEGLGLADQFGVIVGGDSLPRKKPDPEPVFYALRELGLARTRSAVIVGDSANDVLAGRAAGIFTCGVKSNIGQLAPLKASKPDFFIPNLGGLSGLFQ